MSLLLFNPLQQIFLQHYETTAARVLDIAQTPVGINEDNAKFDLVVRGRPARLTHHIVREPENRREAGGQNDEHSQERMIQGPDKSTLKPRASLLAPMPESIGFFCLRHHAVATRISIWPADKKCEPLPICVRYLIVTAAL